MAETRACERCGTAFEPKREHARFCSARCRVAWNREHGTWPDPRQREWSTESWEQAAAAGQPLATPLGWAIIAMRDTTGRLGKIRASDRPQAFAVIGEAVWWVTIVDATLVRYYPDAYEDALAGLPGARRRLIEGTFGGLRFVRNRMGYYADHADFIQPRRSDDGTGDAPITTWTWRPLPAPAVESLPPRGQEWEMSRYAAYQERLAGHTIGETFDRAAGFLVLAARAARQGMAGDGGLSASGR
jgi:endogenous inhibitor of DNA gyrase (YacG/DUF329 family)